MECNWQPCEEPARYRLTAGQNGTTSRDELLCREHTARTRDNLWAVGYWVQHEPIGAPVVTVTGAHRRPSLPPGMCHAACYDEHGHTDGCLYDGPES